VKKAIPRSPSSQRHRRPHGAQHGTIGARSPTTIPRRIIRRRCWPWGDRRHQQRKIAADEFFRALRDRARQGRIITSVSFPVPKRAAYMKFKNPASRYATSRVRRDFGSGVRVAGDRLRPSVFPRAAMEKRLAANVRPESVANIAVPEKGLNRTAREALRGH